MTAAMDHVTVSPTPHERFSSAPNRLSVQRLKFSLELSLSMRVPWLIEVIALHLQPILMTEFAVNFINLQVFYNVRKYLV